MSAAGLVVAFVLLEWAAGLVATAAWTQSWSVIRRGHFRIIAWISVVLAALAVLADRSVVQTARHGTGQVVVVAFAVSVLVYLVVQYSRTDVPGMVVGYVSGAVGAAALVMGAALVLGWPQYLAVLELLAGAALLGSVTNGMLLGHWYLNQPGLKPWALARLTDVSLAATAAAAIAGVAATGRLTSASTAGALLGLDGFGASFALGFYLVWLALLATTAAVVWMARRCVKIRSIQSATGLYYVALLTAGVSEFLVRYLMVGSGAA